MHEVIINCLEQDREFYESEATCYAILRGGFERYLQARLGYRLYGATGGAMLSEEGVGDNLRIDFLDRVTSPTTAIEMGVNSLLNARDGVINHMIDDINKVLNGKKADQVFTIGFVDSMLECQHPQLTNLVKYKDRYRPLMESQKRDAAIAELEDVGHFRNPSLNHFKRISFKTRPFSGYVMGIDCFVCGPFKKPLSKWWRQ